MTRWYVVGQAPARDGSTDLEGFSARKLAHMCGVPFDEWLRRFKRVNLLDDYPGPALGKGDSFDKLKARQRALELVASADIGSRFILLGRNVQASFEFAIKGSEPFFTWVRWGGRWFAVSPHPSGISHWWNFKNNWSRATEFWRGAWQRSSLRE